MNLSWNGSGKGLPTPSPPPFSAQCFLDLFLLTLIPPSTFPDLGQLDAKGNWSMWLGLWWAQGAWWCQGQSWGQKPLLVWLRGVSSPHLTDGASLPSYPHTFL